VAEDSHHDPDILVHGRNKVKLSLTNHFGRRADRGRLRVGGPFDQI
jgi:pterin-4a-carbinolamine dehydratase